MKTIGNLLWLVLAGLWLALGYCVAAALMAITVIGLPFAVVSVRLGVYALWPFGRTLIKAPDRGRGASLIGNVLWFVLAGLWIAIVHIVTGAILCLTIIGIPLGIADFKMASAAIAPFGKVIVRTREVSRRGSV